ncbi:hypothetical protein QUF89_02130 [Peribacillus simplex]|uniref:Uncharacterized protein n=1 Tax=Peribacillus simplex TaxID=1478 RepID=A0AAW7I4Z2_9BACI|nr:hypothetical protein [Peribacillus simplex]MDM5451045.1 hypothetical protein [Peribacillus simplex]
MNTIQDPEQSIDVGVSLPPVSCMIFANNKGT